MLRQNVATTGMTDCAVRNVVSVPNTSPLPWGETHRSFGVTHANCTRGAIPFGGTLVASIASAIANVVPPVEDVLFSKALPTARTRPPGQETLVFLIVRFLWAAIVQAGY